MWRIVTCCWPVIELNVPGWPQGTLGRRVTSDDMSHAALLPTGWRDGGWDTTLIPHTCVVQGGPHFMHFDWITSNFVSFVKQIYCKHTLYPCPFPCQFRLHVARYLHLLGCCGCAVRTCLLNEFDCTIRSLKCNIPDTNLLILWSHLWTMTFLIDPLRKTLRVDHAYLFFLGQWPCPLCGAVAHTVVQQIRVRWFRCAVGLRGRIHEFQTWNKYLKFICSGWKKWRNDLWLKSPTWPFREHLKK